MSYFPCDVHILKLSRPLPPPPPPPLPIYSCPQRKPLKIVQSPLEVSIHLLPECPPPPPQLRSQYLANITPRVFYPNMYLMMRFMACNLMSCGC